MEPEGRPLTPGTSYGPPPFASAQSPVAPASLNCTLQSSRSLNVRDGPMSAKRSRASAGDEGPEQTEGPQPSGDPGRSAQRRFKSSAFPSSLSWDSDSEKETPDEEELQHFSNPHGLAAHSPGSPSSGLRLNSDEDQEPEKLQPLPSRADSSSPAEGHGGDREESTKPEEPNTSQLGLTDLADSDVWNVSEGAELFLSKGKPKEGCQMEEEGEEEEAGHSEGEKRPKGKETTELERDVYTFPGDSDPESPPPAPWAHCTFIQRCRKKRVLLRPFSGLGTLKRKPPEAGLQPGASPQKSKNTDAAQLNLGGGYDFEEERFGEAAVEEPVKFGETGEEEERGEEPSEEIFTCVECSIYFKKQVHLQEHIVEHCQSGAAGGRRSGKGGRFRCFECGWSLPSRLALADHLRRHQESRLKILEEIEKLNENGKARETVKQQASLEPTVGQDASPTSTPGKMSDPEVVPSPPLSPALVSTTDADPAVLHSNATPPNSVRTPAQARALSACRRRFVCATCNFSTRTSQALANHAKTHNRKKAGVQADPPSQPGSPSRLASASLPCGHCAFLTSSPAVMREHQRLVHPGQVSLSGPQSDETGQRSRSITRISKPLDSDRLLESGSSPGAAQGDSQQNAATSEDGTTLDGAAARPTRQVVFKCVGNRRFSRRGKAWSDLAKFLEDDKLTGSAEEERSAELEAAGSPRDAGSPAGGKPHTRARSNTEDCSTQSATLSLPPEKSVKDEDELEAEKDGRLSHLRRSNRVTAAHVEDEDDDDDDIDEERVRRFLSEGFLDEDPDELDEDSEMLRSVERKCPYCPDRFHNGIGLANHVRGHLNRVGVSYNVRHFISPEEVKAIEKKFSYQKKKKKGEEEDAAEDEEERQLPAVDGLRSGRTQKDGLCSVDSGRLSPGEDAHSEVHLKCEVCGVQFETRRGLSSHARSHLRQLGIGVSESSGAPIDLLYQIAKETDGPIKSPPPSVPHKDEALEDMDLDEKPIPLSLLAKAAAAAASSSSTPTPSPGASPAPLHSGSPSSVVRKAPISSLLPVSSPLRSPEHKAGGMKGLTSGLSATVTTKPLWAPQENDAPLNLTLEVDPNKDIVCQLCGAWFETRKGLSSHARAHLRHFGVEYSESKGSPIDLLNQLIDTDDFKHKAGGLQLNSHGEPQGLSTTLASPKQSLLSLASSSSLLCKVTAAGGGSTSKATSPSVPSLLGPPAKRLKSSSMRVFRLSSGELMALPHSEPPKEIGCEFCGEYFENRKGLSSHARSHLRQMGITEWSVNGSPIDTLREIITRRGLPCALPLKPLKTPPPSSPGPPRSPLPTSSPPSATLLSRLPFAFARPSSPAQSSALTKSSSTPPASSGGLILKLKPEPVQLEVTAPGAAGRSAGFSGEALNCSWSSSDSVFPLNLAMAHEVEPTRDIRCEFCGEYFENRKGLSSHARSHLRQMGITEWTVNGSPIDTLREVMHKRGVSPWTHQSVKKESIHGANGPPWESAGGSDGALAYPSAKYRKSPLSLLQSGSRLHKQGLGSTSTAAGKFFRLSPLGKRPPSEDALSADTAHSPPHQLKTLPPLPHDFSFKRKPSPDKHGHQDPSCELCGFYFENRKALASHARAHLRQFGVTEWCVNGSPIETLSAWMRSRPQKVLEMHRNYMQGNRSTLKKKASSSSSSSSSQWSSSLAVSLVRPMSREVGQGSSKAAAGEAGTHMPAPFRPSRGGPSPTRPAGGLPLQAQVARSELNVRLPRGFERRPLKHPSCPDGTESPPKPPRTGTVPALVPKPPSYPLVKLVGKFYTLKCRFCEVEFHGPLSVQEDWIRHLQQHILKMNYNKAAAPKAASAEAPSPGDDPARVQASAPVQASASTSSTTSTTPSLTSTPTRTAASNGRSATPPVAECAPPVTATEIVKVSEEQPTLSPTSLPLPTQTV